MAALKDLDRPSPTSTVALVFGWLCVVAYLVPLSHILGGTYEGIESVGGALLILTPCALLGTLLGGIAYVRSEVGTSTERRAGLALSLIWLTPPVLFLILIFALPLLA
jgi:hypothetical protein